MAVTLFINTRCQLRCRYCFGWDGKATDANNVSAESLEPLLEAFWSKGHRYLTLTGGEPFLHPEIREIVQQAHDKGFWVTILTNGLSIDGDMARYLSKFWRLQVRVSLEGADRESHEYFRGQGTFEPMVRSIDLMKSSGVQVNLGLTIYEENRDQVKKVAAFCLEKGCSTLRVVPVIRIEKGMAAKTSRELYEGILRDILAVSIDLRDHLKLPDGKPLPTLPIESFTTKRCFAGEGFLGVGVDGTLIPCSLIRFGDDVPLIKYSEPADIDRLGRAMHDYSGRIEANQKGICSTCEFLSRCRGGCPGEKLSFGLDPTDGQPVCMKTLLAKVIGEFDPAATKPIVNSWINEMDSGVEELGDGYCMRQAPFWKINFKRTTGRR